MHYDEIKGARAAHGLFSARAVLILLIVLLVAGAYLAVTWFAPDIVVKSAADKQQVEETVMTVSPEKGHDMLYIPALAIQMPLSNRLVESGVWAVRVDDRLFVSAKCKVFGITPLETVRLSPFYQLSRLATDDRIYIDLGGTRTLYQVADDAEDLTLRAVDSENSNDAKITVTARKIGTIEIRDGKGVIR